MNELSTSLNFSTLFWMLSLIAGVLLLFFWRFVSLWFQAFVSGTPISLFNILGMSLRKIPARTIVNSYIILHKAGIKDVTVADLETHYLAGGHLTNVVGAMVAADKANISLSWRQATAIDLAGRDLLEAVRTSVNPKVIDCPDKSYGKYITAVAKNGVQLNCYARVTVRTNLQQLVGGATEETIIARVGEGIINAIGSSDTHLDVLAEPQSISKLVLEKGLDAQTAFEILSIDIADLSVGENIGARLQTDRAESDKRIAQAKAEERRAMAIAMEHENSAKVMEMRAKLVEAEAEVPLAMAEALRKEPMSVMDFYKLKNLDADTQMRRALAEEPPSA